MPERLRSFGSSHGVEIYRYEDGDRRLSGIIFGADGMLLTARHVVDFRIGELPGFEFYPRYDNQEIDVAVRKDPVVKGPQLGYVDELTLAGCYCVTSIVGEPEKLIRIDGSLKPFYEPTLLSLFVPGAVSDIALFEGGTSGSPIIYQGKIIGLIKGSKPESGIVVGVCFNLPDLRALLARYLNLSFVKIESGS